MGVLIWMSKFLRLDWNRKQLASSDRFENCKFAVMDKFGKLSL